MQLITHLVNIAFLVLPILSVYTQHQIFYNRLEDTRGNVDSQLRFIKLQLLELWTLLLSFVVYLLCAIGELSRYKIVYFTTQILISTISISKSFKYNKLETRNFQIVSKSPLFNERGVLLNHETNSSSYHSTISNSAPSKKQQHEQLNFFIDEEQDEMYSDEENNNTRFKLSAPVLATLLLLSPVHTELSPIYPDQSTTDLEIYYVLPIVAFCLLLLSRIIRMFNYHFNDGPKTNKITMSHFLLILSQLIFGSKTNFVFQSSGVVLLPYLLLLLNGILVVQSILI